MNELYPHNKRALSNIITRLDRGDKVTSILHATGTGKSNISLEIARHYPTKKILFITRYNSIIEHIKDIKKRYKKEDNIDINNMTFMTYSSLVNMNREELKKLDVDILITDEFHHVGAPVWQSRIEMIRETHPDMQIVGMSAYSIRDRGTPYERDMAVSGGDEIFSDTVCSIYKLAEAILDGILPFPRYKTVLIVLNDFIDKIEERVNKRYRKSNPLYNELIKKLNYFRSRLNLHEGLDELYKKNINLGDKLIYFCEPGKDETDTNIDSIMKEMMDKLISLGFSKEDIVFYKTTSKDEKAGKLNREAFYNDVDLTGKRVKKKLRIMFAINQYNEGVHVPNLTGVILGRGTKSDIVFYEQIGRGLSVSSERLEEIDELRKLSRDELIKRCNKKGIDVKHTMTNDDLVELLVAPIIIDLAGNFTYIRDLMTDLRNEMVRREKNNIDVSSKGFNITLESFSTEIMGEDIFNILEKINDELSPKTFDEIYELASNFYEYYGHLNIPRNFHTDNGIEFSQFGYSLGEWLAHIKSMKNKNELSVEQIEKLEHIGIVWRVYNSFSENLELARCYYDKYQNLCVPYNYKCEDGYNLGTWIVNMRRKKKLNLLTQEQIDELNKIGMVWEAIQSFTDSYNLLKKYYEYYGDINLPSGFKTNDGINYSEDGFPLRKWLDNQKGSYHKHKLSDEKIIMLERLHIDWKGKKDKEKGLTWEQYYLLAKCYYDNYHDLKIKRDFKTVDGINYDENGYNLGAWLSRQLVNKKKGKLSDDEISMLDSIGIIWTVHESYKSFDEAYEMALEYYEKHGNLLVPVNYRCEDGYNLSSFLYQMRKKRENNLLSLEQIRRLDLIGMLWSTTDNYSRIKEIMKDNGINPRKYATLVRSLSVLEFSVKLRYMKDNNIPLIDNGTLNKLFCMSNIEFMKETGISITDLISTELDVRKKD